MKNYENTLRSGNLCLVKKLFVLKNIESQREWLCVYVYFPRGSLVARNIVLQTSRKSSQVLSETWNIIKTITTRNNTEKVKFKNSSSPVTNAKAEFWK